MSSIGRGSSDFGEETRVLLGGGVSERLLEQLISLPADGDLEDAVWALVSILAEGDDTLCVGACIAQVGGQQLVVRHAPRPLDPRIHDAVRLFPEVEYEEIVDIPFDEGSSLHVAGSTPLDGQLRHEAEQLAGALGSVVRRSRLIEQLRADTAEARSLRDQAVQSDKLAGLGRMAASIVHELNNPLTSIVAYADFLRRRFEQEGFDPADRERLARISEAAGRVLSFTRDLVAYSRPSAAAPSSLDVHEVIERALVFCDHIISEREIQVHKRFGSVPPVFGLHGPLTQVFVNLLTNSCQAMGQEGGSISIRTSVAEESDLVIVDVWDDGPGIQPDIIERLFEPYFTTRGEGGGNGLGLNIVQTIVASHGGRVIASNRQERDPNAPRGAIFSVELPARR